MYTYVHREKYHSTYYGILIFRVCHNGMYNARSPKGRLLADTLQGIKELIKDSLDL